MIKQIRSDQLKPGMFIHDLNCGWLDHPFLTNSFLVRDAATVTKIVELGIREVYIDTIKGADVWEGRSISDVDLENERRLFEAAQKQIERPVSVELKDESARAKRLHLDANRIVRSVMDDARLGQQIEVERVEPMVEGMIESIFRNQDALLPLVRLKKQDDYTFEHSVSVSALLAAFARNMKLPKEDVKALALGGLLHDIGKVQVPEGILNKPGKLTESEMLEAHRHVEHGLVLLDTMSGISQITRDVVAQHHERFDGSGYPQQASGGTISMYGQMAAIVDVYDALTSDRIHQRSISPTQALKKLLEWSKHHFDPQLVQSFVRTLGIYPSGTLVRLESQRLGVVMAQNEGKLIDPVVRVFYHAGQNHYIPPEMIDLSKVPDRIASFENFEKWKIDPYQWLPS